MQHETTLHTRESERNCSPHYFRFPHCTWGQKHQKYMILLSRKYDAIVYQYKIWRLSSTLRLQHNAELCGHNRVQKVEG